MGSETNNLCRVCLSVIASLCYCNLVSGRLPKGKWRLISITPIFYIFTILPLYLTSAFFTAIIAFVVTWLANFKLLLFAFDRGPLSSKPLPIFIAMAALPFRIKPQIETLIPEKSKKIPLNLATEIPISAVIISILYDYKEYIDNHPHILLLVYCCLVFLMIEILIELSSLLLRCLLGLELEPASDEPYLSTSLREFWGRRWNLTVNSVLRETIYSPVRSAATAAMGGDPAAAVGMLAAFTVSGLMHELLVWYVTRARPSGEMAMFFVVQGFCVVVELGLKRRRWVAPPWYVSGPLTVGFVVATSFWLFFPPLIRNGADVRVIQELRFAGEIVKEKIVESWLNMGRRFA